MIRVLGLVLIIVLISLWLGMLWLAYLGVLAGLALFIMMRPRKIRGKAPAKAERDTIYPVIYEDVGEPPFLYPEKQTIKVIPKNTYDTSWEKTVKMVGTVGSFFLAIATGKARKKEKKE